MLNLEIALQAPPDIPLELLEQAVQAALAGQGQPPEADLTLVLSDDQQLRELNRQYMHLDEPTDVLSFPAGELDPETGRPYLGDILISCERAAAQAQAGGHSLAAELQLLVVHGVLHLLGHDHGLPEEKAAMWAAQAQILAGLGNPLSPP
jgi:probable rRNA maturation factor